MRKLVAFAAVLVAACTTMAAEEPEPPVVGQTPGYACRNEGLGGFVGQPATAEAGAEMLRISGARTLRWVAKGMMVTMEFREDRLTVWLDGNNRIERVSCG